MLRLLRSVVIALLLCASCGMFLKAPTPMSTRSYAGAAKGGVRDLLVLLPGRGDRAATFADEGIVELAHRHAPAADVVAVDATMGYYVHRNLVERLMADVFLPARAAGYRSRWISGISMGGLGALLLAQQRPGVVSDVVLVAPFLGDEEVIAEIERAGGVARWQPPAHIDANDYQRELWRWLKGCAEKRESCPRIFLGFGSEDRFVRAHRLLASVLPPAQVAIVPGGHDWQPWRALYALLLPRVGAP